ncbi:MAG TPA: hypothetical protein VGA78_11315 [Gemmatimonadales bacterium]|jgi:uncharacterized membrane protein YfcA
MSLTAATLLASLVAGYLAAGMGFALPFAFRWAGRLDPVAASGTRGFRLLIIPGAMLLWPWLGLRLWRASRTRRP